MGLRRRTGATDFPLHPGPQARSDTRESDPEGQRGGEVPPQPEVLDAWNRMSRTGKSRLMVVQDKQLLGMLSLSDVMQYLALKFDLERGSR